MLRIKSHFIYVLLLLVIPRAYGQKQPPHVVEHSISRRTAIHGPKRANNPIRRRKLTKGKKSSSKGTKSGRDDSGETTVIVSSGSSNKSGKDAKLSQKEDKSHSSGLHKSKASHTPIPSKKQKRSKSLSKSMKNIMRSAEASTLSFQEESLDELPSEPLSSEDESFTSSPATSGDAPAVTSTPTSQPSFSPSTNETAAPSEVKSAAPTQVETPAPSFPPSAIETAAPTQVETNAPSMAETDSPTSPLTNAPTETPRFVGTEQQAVVSYEFEPGDISEPTTEEIFRLELATTAFYLGVFAERYINDPATIFSRILAQVEELLYQPDEIPPIQIDWLFEVSFNANSEVIPSSEEILEIIYADEETLQQYVDIYLQSSDDVWSSVNKISYNDAPAVEVGIVRSPALEFPSTNAKATFLFQFDSEEELSEPSEEEYDRLAYAIGVYLTALLTRKYLNSPDTALTSVTTAITESLFVDETDEPLQVNFDIDVLFSTDSTEIPSSESMFAMMTNNTTPIQFFVQDYLWKEGDIWNDVSDVTIQPLTAIERTGRRKRGPG